MLASRVVVVAALALAGCNNIITGELTPVPPVHRVADDVVGTVILVDEDPAMETKDPEHVARATENRVPQDFRASMVRSFQLAGFRVTSRKEEPHDLVARLALAVSEEKGKVRQVYRCGLRSPDGTVTVAQIDWQWPQGTYVDAAEVFTFATNHVANEVATSPKVSGFLRARRASPTPAPAP